MGGYGYFTHAGHVRDQIIKSHNWEERKEIKGKARDEGCSVDTIEFYIQR